MNTLTKYKNIQFANALSKIPQKMPPIWFMRQAGRYHSHYRNLKEKYSFLELCKNPELAAQVALGPINSFGFDVSILFSDLLFPLEALGMGLKYDPGPTLSHRLTNKNDLKNLKPIDEAVHSLEFQKQALLFTNQILPKDVSLIGFVGGPFTLLTYASIGKHDGNTANLKNNQSFVFDFYEIIIPLLKENIKLQLSGGAELVMIFDTASGILDPILFNDYVTCAIEEIANEFPNRIGYYAKNTTADQLQQIKNIRTLAGFGIDHRYSISQYLQKNQNGFIQGNFDQELLFADKDILKRHIQNYLKPILELSVLERSGWIAGLGHGVLQHTPESSIHTLIDTIREEFSK
ncbi:uroporphyrinogen decarboxylase family protein [Leptospira sp. 96542]|nr:uroporphyrinogen decarboxylase family protein [Leptospira sp. 96542]